MLRSQSTFGAIAMGVLCNSVLGVHWVCLSALRSIVHRWLPRGTVNRFCFGPTAVIERAILPIKPIEIRWWAARSESETGAPNYAIVNNGWIRGGITGVNRYTIVPVVDYEFHFVLNSVINTASSDFPLPLLKPLHHVNRILPTTCAVAVKTSGFFHQNRCHWSRQRRMFSDKLRMQRFTVEVATWMAATAVPNPLSAVPLGACCRYEVSLLWTTPFC